MTNIKLVVFDMDGTLLQPRSCWAYIHDHFGTDNTERLNLYIQNKITDQEFVKADVKQWEESSDEIVNEKYINTILDEIKPIEGAEELVSELHRNNIETIFLSGGITFLAEKWAKKWNMKKPLANNLIDGEDGHLIVEVNASGHAKGAVMDKLLNKLKLEKKQVAAIGDTTVDLPMFERAGLSVAVNTDDKRVIEKADYHLKGDIRELQNLIINW
jgi:HAD superfamily PSPase-like hydrolase|tara:strand:- start:10193 stop:10837 length:645 start_codon:yes stop_codon:yes gene_type:complete